MVDYQQHEQMKKLCITVYKFEKDDSVDGWKYITSVDESNGFYCDVYKKNSKYYPSSYVPSIKEYQVPAMPFVTFL